MKRVTVMLLIATALGLLVSSQVRAMDVCEVERLTDQLACQMDELRGSFRQQFRRASNYGELRSTAASVENSARRIDRLVRSGRDVCEIREEMAGIAGDLRRLDLNLAQARFRAEQGLDPPIPGCTLHVDAKLAAAARTFHCLEAVLAGPIQTIVEHPVPWQAARPPVYGDYGVPYHGHAGAGGAFVQPGRGSVVPRGSGPIPYHGGPAPGEYAPEWNPQWQGSPAGTLPPGGRLEELGPPLSGPAARGSRVIPGGVVSQPIGIHGRRGNGVELGQGGVVLRIGGAAIQLR